MQRYKNAKWKLSPGKCLTHHKFIINQPAIVILLSSRDAKCLTHCTFSYCLPGAKFRDAECLPKMQNGNFFSEIFNSSASQPANIIPVQFHIAVYRINSRYVSVYFLYTGNILYKYITPGASILPECRL